MSFLRRFAAGLSSLFAARPAALVAQADRAQREIAILPAAEARALAEGLLASSPHLEVGPGRGASPPSLDPLSATLRAFFALHPRVETSATSLDCTRIAPLPGAPHLLRIGSADPGGHDHFVVQEAGDAVWEYADDAMGEDPLGVRFPSVWHVVIWMHRYEELLDAEPP